MCPSVHGVPVVSGGADEVQEDRDLSDLFQTQEHLPDLLARSRIWFVNFQPFNVRTVNMLAVFVIIKMFVLLLIFDIPCNVVTMIHKLSIHKFLLFGMFL